MRWRIAALRLVGRLPERAFDLALPADPPRTLAIRTPAYAHVSRVLETTGLAWNEPDTLACFTAAIEEQRFGPVYDIGANIGVYS